MRQMTDVDQALRQAAEAQQIPGVVAVAATGSEVIYQGAYGKRSLDKPDAMTADSVFWIASMTKAITTAAGMQLVEQGKLALDEPVGKVLPDLAAPQVFEGFDASGKPKLRAARRAITLRHLMTHTAGYCYNIWNGAMGRYMEQAGIPGITTCENKALTLPLASDPGERWEYGINIDWVGRLVEAVSGQTLDAYFRDKIFVPLGMKDSGYSTSDEQRARQARVHQRQADGTLVPQPLETLFTPEFWSGGGPLYSTALDYLTFLQMLLHGGSFKGTQLLRPETVARMGQNHIGNIPAGIMKTENPSRSNDVDFFPGAEVRWGLGYMLNMQPGPNGRSAGTVSWGGIFNTYYWLDPVQRVTGLIMTQILPFADQRVLQLYGQFESAAYNAMKAA